MYISYPSVFIQKMWAHWPMPHHGTTKTRLTSLIKNSIHHTIKGPLGHPLLPLPQEELVAHLYPPQAVVVEHLQDHPAQEAGVR